MSLKELYNNGIKYLTYGGEIIHTQENGKDYYDLRKDNDILLCDGEIVNFEKKFNVLTKLLYWFGITENGEYIYLSNDEYKIAVF